MLGASGGIGQPLSMLLKLSPAVQELGLYDVQGTPGVAADLSHVRSLHAFFVCVSDFMCTFIYSLLSQSHTLLFLFRFRRKPMSQGIFQRPEVGHPNPTKA